MNDTSGYEARPPLQGGKTEVNGWLSYPGVWAP